MLMLQLFRLSCFHFRTIPKQNILQPKYEYNFIWKNASRRYTNVTRTGEVHVAATTQQEQGSSRGQHAISTSTRPGIIGQKITKSLKFPPQYPELVQHKGNDENNVALFLEKLEKMKDNGDYKGAVRYFNEYQEQNPGWMHIWPAQKIAATILHIYFKAGKHGVLLELYENLRLNEFKHGEGIYHTLIKCCISKNDISRALEYLEEMKRKGLRNIRIYPVLIKCCISNGKLDDSFRLFKEMQEYELIQKTKKQVNDQEMLAMMMRASTNLSDANFKKKGPEFGISVVKEILDYSKKRCLPLSLDLSKAISDFIDSNNSFSAEINDTLKKQTVEASGMTQQPENILSWVNRIKSNVPGSNFLDEIESLSTFVHKSGPFHLIIDGANVLLTSKHGLRRGQTMLFTDNLLDLINSYKSKALRRKIAIIIPDVLERRSNFSKSKFFNHLRQSFRVDLFVVKFLSDDLAALLTALYSEMKMLRFETNEAGVKLVSNDLLREHVSLLADEQWEFLNWIRSRQIRFSWDSFGEILLQNVPTYDKLNSNEWILPLEDGRVIVIRDKTINSKS